MKVSTNSPANDGADRWRNRTLQRKMRKMATKKKTSLSMLFWTN